MDARRCWPASCLASRMFTKPTAGAFIWGVSAAARPRSDFTNDCAMRRLAAAPSASQLFTGLACIPLGSIWYLRNLALASRRSSRLPKALWLTRALRNGDYHGAAGACGRPRLDRAGNSVQTQPSDGASACFGAVGMLADCWRAGLASNSGALPASASIHRRATSSQRRPPLIATGLAIMADAVCGGLLPQGSLQVSRPRA